MDLILEFRVNNALDSALMGEIPAVNCEVVDFAALVKVVDAVVVVFKLALRLVNASP